MNTDLSLSSFSLAISPCPNDTFAFYHFLCTLKNKCTPSFHDIDALNTHMHTQSYDVIKASFPVWFQHSDTYNVLPAGAALGHNCGPLLVSKKANKDTSSIQKIAVPGIHTTAFLLLQLAFPHPFQAIPMRFDKIMPAVAAGEVDAGLIIHESRFTYPTFGLECVLDLGQWWHTQSQNLPLPLGGIFIKKTVPSDTQQQLSKMLTQSIRYAWHHEEEALTFCQQYATEMDPQVMRQHINLYVNEETQHLSSQGYAAIEKLKHDWSELKNA